MKKKIGVFLMFVVILSGIISLIYITKYKNPYIDVKIDNIKDIILKENIEYIVVYSDKCITCRKLKNDILDIKKNNKSIKNLKIYGLNIGMQNIDSKKIVEKFDMKGVPFILKYKEGKLIQILSGNIKQEELIQFFNKQ